MSDAGDQSPTHLRPFDLDRLLAGERLGLEGALAHLETCAVCRARYEAEVEARDRAVLAGAGEAADELLVLATERTHRHSRRRVIASMTGLAAAAAVAIVCVATLFGDGALPAYGLTLSDGVQNVRDAGAAKAATPRFAPGTRLRLDLRPAQDVSGDVVARVWIARGPSFVELPLSAVHAEGGAVRLEGIIGQDVHLAAGRHTLWVVIARPGEYDDEAAVREAISRGIPRAQGQVLETAIVIDEGPRQETPR